jgi:CspA family cold shock protein
MNFKDTWATNEHGERFVFTVEMQRRLSEAGLPVEPASLAMLDDEESRPPAPPPRDRDREREREREPRPPRQAPPEEPRREAPETPAFEPPESIQIDPQTGKYIGRLKWYNPLRGYGFISRGGGADIFFHKTSTIGNPEEMAEGQWVLYDVEERRKGPEATEVEPFAGEAEGEE